MKNKKTSEVPFSKICSYALQFIAKQKSRFIAIQILALAWSLDKTVGPYFFKIFIDKIVHYTGERLMIWSYLLPIVLSWFAFWMMLEIMYRAQGLVVAKAFPEFEAQVRLSMFDKIKNHTYEFFVNTHAGNLASKISDLTQNLSSVLQRTMLLFAPAAAALFIACVFFLFINYIFACILLGWAVLHFAICLLGFKKCHDLSFQHSAKRNVLTEKIVDTFSNIMCVKLFARQKYEYDYIHSFQAEEKQSQTALLEGVERVKILLGALTFLAPGVLMMYFTIHSWKMNLISVGDVVLIMGATWNVLQLAWITGLEMPNLFRDIGICSQAMTVIEEECSKEETIGQTKENFVKGRIDIDSVRFGYHLNKKIFDDFSVSIEPGSKVALVGMTGSGKSTLVNLLVRLFDCQSGNILIDGVDIAKMPLSSLREQIAVVPQNPVLFCRSVRDNIAYGNQLASEENIIRAAKKAYCHDFIEQLEYGYDTNVGASGVKLSNGQCQQIAIARAFLKDAPILILDEATSALDVLTEAKIQSSIRDLMIGRTTLVIAHRLSTLKNMDTIIVLQEGRIIENATHDALLKKKGHYSAMWHKLGDDINA